MQQLHECPPPEIFALLLENKLPEAKRTEALRHIAGCNECAMTYSIAGAMLKEPVVKAKPVFFKPRYLSYAAAVILLVGAGFAGRFFYARHDYNDSVQLMREPASEYAQFEQPRERLQVESLRSAQPAPPPPRQNQPPQASQAPLARPVQGTQREEQKAEQWIRLNQAAYSALVGQLPPEVWERYPVSEESLKTLSWIAGLPEEEKEKILALPPEDAIQEFLIKENNKE
ncbi:MAG: hypothetical protein FWG71_03790 [Synergistaceae bacterium]|nr:hypothetical protein [Synergistaceae bacterium]